MSFDPVRYRRRNTVERCFQKIKTWRGLATRYDKSPEGYEAGLHLRSDHVAEDADLNHMIQTSNSS